MEPLLKTMGDEDAKVREAASRVLEELGEPLGRLIQSTLAGSLEAGSELAGRKDPRSLDALILSLRNRDGQVRSPPPRSWEKSGILAPSTDWSSWRVGGVFLIAWSLRRPCWESIRSFSPIF